jgi:plastocyanin/mono/diheme cytochrome c family protein
MIRSWRSHRGLRFVSIAIALSVALWQVGSVLAQAPVPAPLSTTPTNNPFGTPIPGVDLAANGPAASIHGDPGKGRTLFAINCASCHNDRGTGGIDNPGSDDGTIPPLYPLDPGFFEQSQGDPAAFAQSIDVFLQHGSRPAGPNPQQSMIAWGDQKLLSQNDIADAEAYVMSLNGVYWPDRWTPPADVRVKASFDEDFDEITYEITVVNQGAGSLKTLNLADTLPEGLTYQTSYTPAPGQNEGKVVGSTVEWNNQTGVPQAETMGPFVVIADRVGKDVPPNVVQLDFTWLTLDGTLVHSTAVSLPAVPSRPQTVPPAAVNAPPIPTLAVPTVTPKATPEEESESPPAKATETARVPTATPIPVAAVPTVRAPQSYGDTIVQPTDEPTSWGYSPSSLTVLVGDVVTWTNGGAFQHTVTANDGSFESGLVDSGASFSFTFSTAGTYNYHCAPHPWMTGTIVVQGS